MAGERFAAAPTERVQNLVLGAVWREIQVEGYVAVGVECFAQRTRKRVDETAFNTVLADDAFASALMRLTQMIGKANADGFERCTGKLVLQVFGPAHLKTAVGAL